MGPQSDEDLEVMWVIPFQNVIGSFMYAMVFKRLEIGHVVGVVSQFMVNFEQSHCIAMKQIFIICKAQWILVYV
jgi:hypothetical protein